MTDSENLTGSLTRRELRQLRLTGQAPVVGADVVEPLPEPPRREVSVTIQEPAVGEATPEQAPQVPEAKPVDGAQGAGMSRRAMRELRETQRLKALGKSSQAEKIPVPPQREVHVSGDTPVVVSEPEPLSDTPVAAVQKEAVKEKAEDTSGFARASSAIIHPDSNLPPLTAPVAASGETLVTGTFTFPKELSTEGTVPGTADAAEIDMGLNYGELPAASSPTPIAATAAVNQTKSPGEVIKPPAPDKSNRAIVSLAIAAGVIAVALGGLFVYAIMSGVFS